VFNAIFNNISAILWSVLFLDITYIIEIIQTFTLQYAGLWRFMPFSTIFHL